MITPEFIRQAENAIQNLPLEFQCEARESLPLLHQLVAAVNTQKCATRATLSVLLSIYLELLLIDGLEQEGADVLMTKAFELARRAGERRTTQIQANPGMGAVH